MKTLEELLDERTALVNRVEALNKLSEEEATPETHAEIEAAIGENGTIAALDKQIRTQERIRDLMRDQSKRAEPAPNTPDTTVTAKVTIPIEARCYGGSKIFPRIEDAYAAGRWYLAALLSHGPSAQWCQDHGIQMALSTDVNSKGGFLVPTLLESTIISLLEQYGTFRRFAWNYPMGSDSTVIPRRSSGLTAYFVGENAEVTASDIAWDAVQLTAHKLAVLCKYSSELSEDAVVSIADAITQEVAYAFAVKEDACGFLGDGTSTYGHMLGLKNSLAAGSKYTALTANTAFSTLDLADFESMIGQLPAFAGIQPRWFIHKAGWAASMMRLADAAGGNTIRDIAGGGTMQFLGYPVEFCQGLNSTLTAQTSTTGLCYFGDLRMSSVFGVRRGMTMRASTERYLEYDQLAILATERFDIKNHGNGTASVAGPMIVLVTPSS